MSRLRTLALTCALAVVCGGCSLSKFAVDTLAGGMTGGGDSLRAHFDYETAGHGAASSIMQLEAFLGISPNNENLLLGLAQLYMAYSFGWVMDEHEVALFEERFDEADRHKHRSYLMYSRARDLIMKAMRLRDDGLDDVLYADSALLKVYLEEHYDDPDDVQLLFWCALSWGATINNSPSLEDLIDLPNVKIMTQHASELDAGYEDAGPVALLGGLEAAYPQQLGGDLDKGRAYFLEALKRTERKNHMHLLNFARVYAVNAQDRKLYVDLLREIVESADTGPQRRLSNKVARRRAQRYLQHVDELF